MLMPKKVKRRKVQKGRMKGKATRGNKLAYGDYGMITTEPSWITSNQIESARIALTRKVKGTGKVWIDIFPDKPITKKPAETRMGSGKGNPEYWKLTESAWQSQKKRLDLQDTNYHVTQNLLLEKV